jgi:hypothetical protein
VALIRKAHPKAKAVKVRHLSHVLLGLCRLHP